VTDAVSYEVRDRVALVTIERPEVKNAMNLAVFDQLRERAEQAAADDAVGAVLVSGRGGTFSSGIDTSVFGEFQGGVTAEAVARLQASFTAFEELDKPTIAAVEGHCYGAGLQLALACHVRAVAPDARLSMMEIRWALVPDLGGTYRLPRLVGQGRATELALTGRKVSAEEAVAMGLAEVALGEQPPLEEAFAYAARLAAGPYSRREIPRLMRDNLGRDRDAALRAEGEAQMRAIGHPDFAEAVTAALEQREPRFAG
jgi:enoyl-CoA hydratase/carnithine racemase